MVKKSIAAALFVVMVAWAEMALAPMLLMHAGHVHPAREMSEHMAAYHHVMPPGRHYPCCPGISNTENTAPLEIANTSLPCQDEHHCCFRQGPLSVPAPVGAEHRFSRAIAPAEAAELSLPKAASNDFPATAVAPGPPPGLLAMVLRV